jgi:hypothetical protein
MRRLLLIVLALVLPLKAVAAGVVPIVGAPEHAHVPAHAAAQTTVAQKHDDCGAHAAEVPADRETLHEHACPHLGMAFVAQSPATFGPERSAPRAPDTFAANFVSVVLDVPSPPPTRRA